MMSARPVPRSESLPGPAFLESCLGVPDAAGSGQRGRGQDERGRHHERGHADATRASEVHTMGGHVVLQGDRDWCSEGKNEAPLVIGGMREPLPPQARGSAGYARSVNSTLRALTSATASTTWTSAPTGSVVLAHHPGLHRGLGDCSRPCFGSFSSTSRTTPVEPLADRAEQRGLDQVHDGDS